MSRPYPIDTFCDVCGGSGVTTLGDLNKMWTPRPKWGIVRTLRHVDPQVCAANLAATNPTGVKT